MGNWNLPPGVMDSMLPGNRPADVAYDRAVERYLDTVDWVSHRARLVMPNEPRLEPILVELRQAAEWEAGTGNGPSGGVERAVAKLRDLCGSKPPEVGGAVLVDEVEHILAVPEFGVAGFWNE